MGEVQIFTIAVLASFITWKFINAMYDNLYEPAIDVIMDSDKTDDYYIKIGSCYVQIGMIIKEFIKWIVLLLVLMIIYNIFISRKKS